MVTVRVLDRETKKIHIEEGLDRVADLCANDAHVVWVDIEEPGEEDFAHLADQFRFHPLAIEDCRFTHERPKVEEFKGYYFIVLYEVALVGSRQKLELREMNLFLGSNYLVTVHRQPLRAIETAAELWEEWADDVDTSAGLLAYLLIDAVVDDYLPLLDDYSERIDDLEDRIFAAYDPDAIKEIFYIKKHLVLLRRTIVPLRDVFNTLLRREQPIFERDIRVYFQDVFDHLIRVAEAIDTLREMIGSAMEAYLSISGNRMNVVMKRLTSIATILMSVTLIASIYGMNFEVMPELRWRFGYVGALSAMVIVGVALYVYLRKSDWL